LTSKVLSSDEADRNYTQNKTVIKYFVDSTYIGLIVESILIF